MAKKIIISICVILFIFGIGFCAGRFTRLGRIKSDSNGIEQGIDNTGNAVSSAGASIEDGINLINSGSAFTDIAIGSIDRATVLNIELQSKLDELTRITKTYQENLQLANTTVNDLLDYSIRKSELDEEFIRSVIELSRNCE